VQAVEQHNVKFNLGTSRRWNAGVDVIRRLIAESAPQVIASADWLGV